MSGEDLVQQWLNDADTDNPAGSLFISGEFAEGDIASETSAFTGWCGSSCTFSSTRFCC